MFYDESYEWKKYNNNKTLIDHDMICVWLKPAKLTMLLSKPDSCILLFIFNTKKEWEKRKL